MGRPARRPVPCRSFGDRPGTDGEGATLDIWNLELIARGILGGVVTALVHLRADPRSGRAPWSTVVGAVAVFVTCVLSYELRPWFSVALALLAIGALLGGRVGYAVRLSAAGCLLVDLWGQALVTLAVPVAALLTVAVVDRPGGRGCGPGRMPTGPWSALTAVTILALWGCTPDTEGPLLIGVVAAPLLALSWVTWLRGAVRAGTPTQASDRSSPDGPGAPWTGILLVTAWAAAYGMRARLAGVPATWTLYLVLAAWPLVEHLRRARSSIPVPPARAWSAAVTLGTVAMVCSRTYGLWFDLPHALPLGLLTGVFVLACWVGVGATTISGHPGGSRRVAGPATGQDPTSNPPSGSDRLRWSRPGTGSG